MKLCLRPANAEDNLDVDIFLWIACDAESDMYVATTDREEAREEMRGTNVFIIECNDASMGKDPSHEDIYRPIGYIAYVRQSATAAYISDFAVHSSYRGRGIGWQVFYLFMDMLMDEGFTQLSLHAHPDNPVKRLYRDFNFHEGGIIQNFLGSGQPRVFMTCVL